MTSNIHIIHFWFQHGIQLKLDLRLNCFSMSVNEFPFDISKKGKGKYLYL